MAKKPRTPPPPPVRRPVQAPRRRSSTAQRSDADRRRVKMLMLVAGASIVALGAIVAVVLAARGGKTGGSSVAAAMQAAGCTLKTAPATSRKHVASEDAKIKYNTVPPSTGAHYFQPAIWDFYTSPASPVQLVHNEEHGGIVLWWGSKVPQSTVDKLREFYDSSPNGMVGTPFPSLGNKVAITAWTSPPGAMGRGHVAVCTSFDEKAFGAFRDAYRGQGPERYPVDLLTPGT